MSDHLPDAVVERIAARGVCSADCTHPTCNAARLAAEVLAHRRRKAAVLDAIDRRLTELRADPR